MKKLIFSCVIFLMVILLIALIGCQQSVPDVVSRQAVVMVKAQYRDGSTDKHSGFIISPDGYIFTFLLNWDEVENVEVILDNGHSFQASIAAIDTLNNAARIKIEATNLSPLVLPDQDMELAKGDEVVAVGYVDGKFTTKTAKVLELNSALPSPWTEVPAIELDTGGEQGMMGGPVMNGAAHLVGAMLAVESESFMAPANSIKTMFFPTYEKIPPPPITSPPPPETNWEKGSPPPAGIEGLEKPRLLTEDEKAKVVEIAPSSQRVSEWLGGRMDYRTSPIGWYAIIWNSDGEAGTWRSLEYNRVANEGIPDFISPYALWYPGVP